MNTLYRRAPTQNDILHYGRKGMKWGQHVFGNIKKITSMVRIKRKNSKSQKEARKKKLAEAKTVKVSDLKKQIEKDLDIEKALKYQKYYSNKELKVLMERYNTINNMKKISLQSKKNKSIMAKGKKLIETGLEYGETLNKVYKFTNSELGQALKSEHRKSQKKKKR